MGTPLVRYSKSLPVIPPFCKEVFQLLKISNEAVDCISIARSRETKPTDSTGMSGKQLACLKKMPSVPPAYLTTISSQQTTPPSTRSTRARNSGVRSLRASPSSCKVPVYVISNLFDRCLFLRKSTSSGSNPFVTISLRCKGSRNKRSETPLETDMTQSALCVVFLAKERLSSVSVASEYTKESL